MSGVVASVEIYPVWKSIRLLHKKLRHSSTVQLVSIPQSSFKKG